MAPADQPARMSRGRTVRLAALGFHVTGPIIGGVIVGHYLDLYFQTDPWITLVCFLLGVAAGGINLVLGLAEFQRAS